MKIGAFAVLLGKRPFEEVLDYLVGYDHVLSIEHEDSLLSVREGLTKAMALLKESVIGEPAGAMWWA